MKPTHQEGLRSTITTPQTRLRRKHVPTPNDGFEPTFSLRITTFSQTRRTPIQTQWLTLIAVTSSYASYYYYYYLRSKMI